MSSNGTKNLGHYIGIDLAASVYYSVGDKVRITEQFDENYGMIGTIMRHEQDDDSYLLEFEYDSPAFGSNSKSTNWYYGTSDFVHANKTTYTPKNVSSETYCFHSWKEDKWFTSKIFKTCVKCGKKAEDV